MKRIVVLGAAESGCGAAILAKKEGFDVFVSDMSNIKDKYKKMLDDHDIEWEEGKHTEEKILCADEVIKSPGIPDQAPMMQKIIGKGIHVISEIEFAGRYTNAKMICITGSNGKTTTTSLIYHIVKNAGLDAGLAGNIGNSLALQVAETPHQWYVIELSSFQLDNMYDFKADIAVLLNITPDHLDRYGFEMQNYTNAKMRITQNQTAKDAFIYWNGDPIIAEELRKRTDIGGELCPFSEQDFTLDQDECQLKGRHNIYNMLAAMIACRKAGIAEDVIVENVKNFPGVEHRLQKIGTVNDIDFINDSKATNVDACYFALESIKGKCVLIVGGVDKGNDYEPLKPLITEKCSGLVYLGTNNAKLHETFDNMGIPVMETRSMKDCVDACMQLAKPGQAVLLSPCCASFDLFRNMEDRGEQFIEQFNRIKEGK
ncbi:MAG: UDP-N-acetylmuramoyl-L-alanine--D-glutamate ligase [Prevotella sp.]|nr:UDP-N-acetylmuramoyl-L-alanine--D-glutamate ligase [Prevotella sp.]